MKTILENWKKYMLSEKLVLKPGPNGWDKYCELVAEAYKRAPLYEEGAVPSFRAMKPFIDKMFTRIQGVVDVQFVEEHPYKSADELRRDVRKTGIMKISTLDQDLPHDIYDEETNVKFRAVHDFMAHVQRRTEFDAKGEIASYNAHIQTMPLESHPALFTEVVGQACTFVVTGAFPVQKIAILKEFDFRSVGVVEGYEIVNKELVKKGDEPRENEDERGTE